MHNGGLSSDAVESLEVAIQCLESAYSVSGADESLRPNIPLLDIFQDVTGSIEAVSVRSYFQICDPDLLLCTPCWYNNCFSIQFGLNCH